MRLDKKYLNIALFCLEKIIGRSFPNPTVFSLLVESNKTFEDNKIVSFGFTSPGGRPHAESNTLENFCFKNNKIYSLYSTLEPCSHFGRDESCVSKILKTKKINRVIFSLKDPDERVNGNGEKLLKKNKLVVKSNILKSKSENLYYGYSLNRKKGRPKIILKLALTLDGYITLKKGKRTKITNAKSDTFIDILRSEVDAILVGSNTVKIDDCILKCKMPSLIDKSPIRIILNKKLDLNIKSNVFKNCDKFRTIIFTDNNCEKKISKFKKNHVEVITLPTKNYNLKSILKKLSSFGVSNLLVEGGGKVFNSFFKENLFDNIYIFRSNFSSGIKKNKFLQGKINLNKSIFFKKEIKKFGEDTLEIYNKKNIEGVK